MEWLKTNALADQRDQKIILGEMGKILYEYLVKTNLYISLCAAAFFFTGQLFLDQWDGNFLSTEVVLVFFSTLLIYNVSQLKFGIAHFLRVGSVKSIVLFMLTLLPILLLVWRLDWLTLIYFGHLGLISVLYNSPLLSRMKYLPLRSIPLIKIFLIAYIWASIGSFFPALSQGREIDFQVSFLFVFQFLFIVAITLPFDIRDFYKDFRNDLKTLPGVLGIQNTKLLAYGALLCHTMLLFVDFYFSWVFVPLIVLTFFLIKNASASRPDHYYTFYIDGLIILQFLILFVSKAL